MKLPSFLFHYQVTLPVSFRETVMQFFYQKRKNAKIDSTADETFTFDVKKEEWQILQYDLDGIITKPEPRGLLPLIKKKKGRIGLLIGVLLSVFLFILLSGRVWDVRITGNYRISDQEIERELDRAGLTVGTRLSTLDTKKIAGKVLLVSHDLSYISIHVRGTVAYVQVMERKVPSGEEKPLVGGANLVAGADAVIDWLAVKDGHILVQNGQVVKKGDLLVSGIREGSQGSQFTYASGAVYGRVKRRFTVTLPRGYIPMQIAEKKTVGIQLFFFEKNINIYTNTGNLPPTYDTIYERVCGTVGPGFSLPFGVVRTVALAYREEQQPLTDEALVRLAYDRLHAEMARALQDGELLTKTIQGSFTDDAYTLICEVECIENIAKTVEFTSP